MESPSSPAGAVAASPFRTLPKIELHCHLDASVRVETVREIAHETGVRYSEPLRDALVVTDQCVDLADYLRRIELAVEAMQRPQDLKRIATEAVEDIAADGVIYAELRFAPQLHLRRGMDMQQVLDSVSAGLREGGRLFGVEVGLIVCCLRHEPPELSRKVAELAVANTDKVCALDIAGDEARYPAAPHAEAFRMAREAGLRRTVHAGEAAGGESVVEALRVLHAERIGHGVRLESSAEAFREVKTRGIPVEMCPTSNVQTNAVASLRGHPIDRLLRQDVKVTVSTDGRVTSDSTLTGEFDKLARQFAWSLDEFWQCQRNAAEGAFTTPETRQKLLARLEEAERMVASAAR
jgi:adenosine deaminase